MNTVLAVIASVFLGFAALLHVVIFYFESVGWTKPEVYRRFGVKTAEEAEIVRPMAYNQGWYNLFLAVGVAFGLVMTWSDSLNQAGLGLAFFAGMSMVTAATVLLISSPKLARAALTQGAAPLVGVVLLALALIPA